MLRHRIEHASVLREDLIKRVRELGIALAVQPHFVITDWWVVSRVGADRARYVYPFKTLIDNGVMLGFSTDAPPVEPLNPWETVYAAVTRGCHEGIELCRYTENEKVSVQTHFTITHTVLRTYSVRRTNSANSSQATWRTS